MSAPVRRRTVTVTDEAVPTITVPRGRSSAERRIGAVAALHSPIPRVISGRGIVPDEVIYVCGECKMADRYEVRSVRWPCATARLLGEWPGEVPA